MTVQINVIRGTLDADGTLRLDARPQVPAGPVEITIRALSQPLPSTENWWEFLQKRRAELHAAGSAFMTEDEVRRHIDDLRAGDERLDGVYRRMDDERRAVHDVDLP